MVVSRKNPVAAPAVASRSNSSQPTPRRQTKEQNTTSKPSPSPKKQPSRRTRRPPKNGSSFLDKLFLFSLFAFTLYAAVVCPQHLQSPTPDALSTPVTCRALYSYRKHILDPYVLPPLKTAYNSPVIQQYAKPIVEKTCTVDNAVRPKVVKSYRTVKGVLVPWYTRAFLPRWNQYVAPRLEKGWKEGVEKPLRPYFYTIHVHSTKVQRELHAHLRRAEDAILPYWKAAQPHLARVYAILIDLWVKIQPYARTAFATSQKVAGEVWVKAKPIIATSAEQAQVYAKLGAKGAIEARRRYVDPHIQKILEKVDGNASSSSFVSAASTSPEATPHPDPTYPSDAEPTPTEDVEEVASSTVILEEIPNTDESTPVQVVVEPASSSAEQVSVTVETPEASSASPPEATPEEDVAQEEPTLDVPVTPASESPSPTPTVNPAVEEELRAISVAQESAEAAFTPGTPDPDVNVQEALAAPSGPAKVLEEEIKERLAEETVPAGGVAAKSTPDIELDDFLSELGVEFSDSNESETAPKVAAEQENATPPREPTPEESLAAIAAKRADIVGRHVEWQRKLDELVPIQARRVYIEIDGVREWAVSELGEAFADQDLKKHKAQLKKVDGLPESRYRPLPDQPSGNGLGNKVLEGLNKQGERFVRGLETYVGSLEARRNAWVRPVSGEETPEQQKKRQQTMDSETNKWTAVVDKVEAKFEKMVTDVQGEVHTWYLGVRGREAEIIEEAAESIKKLAERAQADIAMDYAWLEDVSTKDWANYHELMTTYEDFQQTALAIQNGTYVPSDIFTPDTSLQEASLAPNYDPLIYALNNLQAEFDDIVTGFRLAVSKVKKRAANVLSDSPSISEDEGPDGYFAVKHEKGERVDDMREYLKAKERQQLKEQVRSGEQPQVSILPIGGGGSGAGVGVGDDSRVVVGKDPKVVAEALKDQPVVHREEL
ncbi:hypothetical protein CC2G_011486 [Coprinopsis cinerea AmutBmut pab1-1]|nr:hypothetical protein CC2G_011486 [Coprinopsis cinerea AmutBmut pab1-1]